MTFPPLPPVTDSQAVVLVVLVGAFLYLNHNGEPLELAAKTVVGLAVGLYLAMSGGGPPASVGPAPVLA